MNLRNLSATLSGNWKLSRVLTPFVTTAQDRKSTRTLGTVFNVAYCLAILTLCLLSYIYKGISGLLITFVIFAITGAIIQALTISTKKKSGRPASSVKTLESCFRKTETCEKFRNYTKDYLQTHDTLDGSFVFTAYDYFDRSKQFSPDLKSADRFSRIMSGEFPLSYKDHQNIYLRTTRDSLRKDLEKMEK